MVNLALPEDTEGDEGWARIKMQEEGLDDPSLVKERINNNTMGVYCVWGVKKFGISFQYHSEGEYYTKMYKARVAVLAAVYKHVTGKTLR